MAGSQTSDQSLRLKGVDGTRSAAGRPGPLQLWSALPLALLRAVLTLLRPSRLLALVLVFALAALLPSAAALAGWDAAVAWVQGDLLRSAPFDWWLRHAEAVGLGGMRAMLGPLVIALAWLLAVSGLVAWLSSVLLLRWLWAPLPLPAPGRTRRALAGAVAVLVYWSGCLLLAPLAALPLVGWVLPVLLWAWLLTRLVLAEVEACFRVPRRRLRGPVGAAALVLAIGSILPPLAVVAPSALALVAGQLARRWHDDELQGETDEGN